MSENERLKFFRQHLKKSQGDFAKDLGIKQGSLSDIERSRNNISPKIKLLLERNYQLNISWLESGKGEMITKKTEIKPYPTDKVLIENQLLREQIADYEVKLKEAWIEIGKLSKGKDKS